jgi:hypothetical protein
VIGAIMFSGLLIYFGLCNVAKAITTSRGATTDHTPDKLDYLRSNGVG